VIRYAGARAPAVNEVSFAAPRGAVTAVVGPNGSGKSTLVRALLRLTPVSAGTISIDGSDLAHLDRRTVAQRVAVVAQRESLVFPLPVWEYVALGRHPHEGPWAAATSRTDAAIAAALDRAGIAALGDRSTDELSGGEWQRVRIARALAQGGEAFVLDEPTTFLDIAHEMAMFELFARLARDGVAVLMVSHQLNLVARFADTMVLLHGGRVAAAGTPADVMRASVLEDVYEWPLLITRDPAVGAPALLPLRNRGPRSPSQFP
ncbi:MAG: ABC transporter ATP-binding protein, partial [Gemmatimonadota bacterium]|nr:ABC transporter ATP-binding protein [Gemmatimonadota bacterium]